MRADKDHQLNVIDYRVCEFGSIDLFGAAVEGRELCRCSQFSFYKYYPFYLSRLNKKLVSIFYVLSSEVERGSRSLSFFSNLLTTTISRIDPFLGKSEGPEELRFS